MGRKSKRETNLDTLLDQSLDKQGRSRSKGTPPGRPVSKIWPRQHIRLALSLTVLLMVGLGSSVWAWQNGFLFQGTGPSGLRAVLVDGLSVSYPNPSFTNNITKTLSSAGYSVDYIGPDKFTVDSFANLPSQGYGLVIIRAHTAHSAIITPEIYTGSKYVFEQLAGGVSPATIGTPVEYFAVSAQFISSASHGRFQNAIIVLMGCGDPGDRMTFAAAYADRGARYVIGFDNSVSASYTDSATSALVSALAHGNSVPESVSIVSSPDPVYHGQYGFVEASSVIQARTVNLLSELSLFATFGVLLVFGPLCVFLIPKLFARR
jgi:hypothetical protein